MSSRLIPFAIVALLAIIAAWTVLASAAFLWFADLWGHPYFAHGLRWTWAWHSYFFTPKMRMTYEPTLELSGFGSAALVGIAAFRVCEFWVNSGRTNR